jgi:hypothetical protein
MSVFRKYFYFLMIVMGLATLGFAANSNLSDNYYVQPGSIYIAPNGIYASIDEMLIQINTLCADERGIFVPYSEIAGRLEKCPFCQRWYDPDSKVPHKCRGTPD